MADVLTPAQRSHNMSRIRSKDTNPELLLRRELHAARFRFRLHRKDLPGCPDLVFPSRRAVIFVHGCFWHGHACPMYTMPATRPEFWRAKIETNHARDLRSVESLRDAGWRVLIIWECALRGVARLSKGEAVARCAAFLCDEHNDSHSIEGDWGRASSPLLLD